MNSTFLKIVVSVAIIGAANLPAMAQRANPFDGARSWAYQLNNLGDKQRGLIAASKYDVMVVDYARDLASDLTDVPLTKAQVSKMKVKPDGGRRLVIAYLSIGESENNRYYWRSEWNRRRPDWMGRESKEWKGNYLVKYWNPTWQSIIFGNPKSFVDRIIAAGFDGFYIDRADAYYRFGDTKKARQQMVDFVVNLVGYIRSKKPDAAIMMQNAEELLEYPRLVKAIDAIAKEDLVYGISHHETRNPNEEIVYSTGLLKAAQKAGKKIFVVEYLKNADNIRAAKKWMAERDFVLYYGPRGLYQIPSARAK